MESGKELFDVTIIGGGPVGLYGLFYARLRGMKAKIVDALPELGGQLVTLYPEKNIFDVGGIPRIIGRDLAKQLVEQALSLNPTVCLGEKVISFVRHEEAGQSDFELITENGTSHLTKSILLTAGIGAFNPKKLEGRGIENFEGKGVHYFVLEKKEFKGKDVLIIGGGDSAVDWVLNLLDTAANITLIHRRDGFGAHEESVREMMGSRADIRTSYELKMIRGDSRVEEAVIYNNKTLEETTLSVSEIILNLGFHADLGPIKRWGLEIDKGGIVVNARMETNITGIYAAGDVASHPGKLKLIATGFGEAATAINFAKKFVDPASKVYPRHSSDMKSLPTSTAD